MGVLAFLRRIAACLSPYRQRAVVILIALLLETGFNGALPISFKLLIDRAIVPRDQHVLFLILALLVAGMLLVSVSGVLRDYLYADVCSRVLNDLRRQMFEHLQRLSMGYYSHAEVGDLLARFSTDLASVENAVTAAIPWAVLPALDILLCIGLLFALEWRLALVAMLVFPLSLLGPRVFAPRASAASYGRKRHESRLLTTVQENLAAQPVVKMFGLERRAMASFSERTGELGRSALQVGFLSALVERSAVVGILMLHVVVLGAGAYLTFRGILSIGTLTAFQSLFLTLSWSLSYVTQYVPNLVQAAGGMTRIDELLREVPQVVDLDGAIALPRLEHEIAFENVSFSYGNNPTLDTVSFIVRAGESVAVVGPSGSGKSTVLNLLTRFYDPDAGRITIDGTPLQGGTQQSWRAQIGMVFQDSFLFNTSVRENIRIGDLGASDAAVEAAAAAAEIHALIVGMSQGYDTVVGERGGRLSGGQRQRLAIARALLRNPAVLLLDEATSALDAGTEAAINATIERIGEGRTVIMVTHRLSSVVGMDRIFVLDNGRLAEQGPHDALMARGGLYAQLWQKQGGFVLSADGTSAKVTAARLRSIRTLASLSDQLLEGVAQRFTTERYPAGRVIVHEGDPGDKFYIVVRGSLRVTAGGADGTERQVAVLEDGDSFGEIALLQDVPRTATVRTLSATLLVALQHHQFAELMERAPELRRQLDQQSGTRLADLTRLVKGEA